MEDKTNDQEQKKALVAGVTANNAVLASLASSVEKFLTPGAVADNPAQGIATAAALAAAEKAAATANERMVALESSVGDLKGDVGDLKGDVKQMLALMMAQQAKN